MLTPGESLRNQVSATRARGPQLADFRNAFGTDSAVTDQAVSLQVNSLLDKLQPDSIMPQSQRRFLCTCEVSLKGEAGGRPSYCRIDQECHLESLDLPRSPDKLSLHLCMPWASYNGLIGRWPKLCNRVSDEWDRR